MKLYLLGGGYVTAKGFGTLDNAGKPEVLPGVPPIPKGKAIFRTPLTRYGRFDRYTKLGCAGIALAVRDACLDEAETKRPVGIVLSTAYESYASDLEFYQTTIEGNGAFTSPNLFSYTLPGIVLGEMAIHFKMTGPTIIVGEAEGRGRRALQTAAECLQAGLCETIVAGWLDSPPEPLAGAQDRHGSVFVALSTQNNGGEAARTIENREHTLWAGTEEITSVLDLFY